MGLKHGVYSRIIASSPSASLSDLFMVPVYIGTAPVNIVGQAANLNKPILINSLDVAKAALGYSDDWATFTLCEAMKAHFDNDIENVGPIILINVLDPATHKKTGSASITPANKVAWIDKETVVLDSCAITGKTAGTDFAVEYVYKNGRYQVLVTDKTVAGLGTVTVSFSEIDITKVTKDVIIGTASETAGRSGLQAVDLIYHVYDVVPGILAAPGWTHLPDVFAALVTKCTTINNKWHAVAVADIDASTATTRALAKTWKTTNAYTSERVKVCWPMAVKSGMKYHLSTLAVVTMMTVDAQNANVPYESPSNKRVDSNGPVLADGTAVYLDETDANDLNAVGITTLNKTGGAWRLWGANMSNYNYIGESDILPENLFDATVRMQIFLANMLQESYLNEVDNPANDRQIQSVCDSAQPWLNGLVTMGALKGAEIRYDKAANPDSETVAGRYRYKVRYNDVPPETALTFDVTRDGSLVAGR